MAKLKTGGARAAKAKSGKGFVVKQGGNQRILGRFKTKAAAQKAAAAKRKKNRVDVKNQRGRKK
jgi:hypothetical protein